MLYDDIEGDQRLYDIFAVLILAGAAFAAFNLAGRIVEAQRREIGIGMALGVPRRSTRDPAAPGRGGDCAARASCSASRRLRRERRHGFGAARLLPAPGLAVPVPSRGLRPGGGDRLRCCR